VTTTDRPRAPCPKTRARQRPGPLFIHQHGLSLDDELEERLQAAALAARLAPIALVRSATPLGGLAPLEPGPRSSSTPASGGRSGSAAD